jgi:flagellar biosynthesis protein FlhG
VDILMNDQAENLRQQLNNSMKKKEAKTISIVSGKGGVGKSNFAINFSIELLKREKKVLLFDLDVGMGNIDILLGLHAELTIIDMIEKRLPINDIIEKGPNHLSYISGGTGLTDFFTMDQHERNYFYDQYQQLVTDYDYIIFDMGAGATSDSIFFVLASDESIVITTPEPTSITDAYGMIKHIVNNQRNMPIYVVMNRCPSKRIGKRSLERFGLVVSKFLHVDIKELGQLPDDKMVTTAVMKQTPYILLNEKQPISKALKEVVDYYISCTDEPNHSNTVSFIQKLTQFLKVR